MSGPISTTNDFFVGTNGQHVTMVLPPVGPMTTDTALRLAAWLVVVAQATTPLDTEERFNEILREVQKT